MEKTKLMKFDEEAEKSIVIKLNFDTKEDVDGIINDAVDKYLEILNGINGISNRGIY